MDEKTAPSGPRAAPSADTFPEVRYGNAVVKRPLGRGGMGEVLLAYHEGFQTPVCVKLLPEAFNDTALVDRFLREAQVAVRLDHANIVRVYDVGKAHGRVYMVMEYVEGQDLEAYSSDHGGRLPLIEALRLVAQAARGIAYAHAQGVIHRDIKPSNLVRRAKDEVVKVVDFGLARAAGFDQLTNDGGAMGTLPYMAYEQLLGSPAAPSDVYALGVSLYRMISGTMPVRGPIEEILKYHREGSPPPLTTFRPTPERVQTLVSRMMEKRPEARPTAEAAAAEMEGLLRELAPEQGSGARPSMEALGRLAAGLKEQTHGEEPSAAAVQEPPKRGAMRLGILAAAAVVLVSFLVWKFHAASPASHGGTPGPEAVATKEPTALAVLIRPLELRSFAKNEMARQPLPTDGHRGLPGVVHSGEGLRFALVAQEPRQVYLFGVDTAGEAACLFPDFFEAQFAQELKEGKVVGAPPKNPLKVEDGTIYVPPIVVAPGGRLEARWFTADESTGKEWFLVASSETPIAELEALRKAPDLAKRGDELKGLAARWAREQGPAGDPAQDDSPLELRRFREERLVPPCLSRVKTSPRAVWTLTLDHQK